MQACAVLLESGWLDVYNRARLAQTCRELHRQQQQSPSFQRLAIEPRLLWLSAQLPDSPRWLFTSTQRKFYQPVDIVITEDLGGYISRRRCLAYLLERGLQSAAHVDRLITLLQTVIRAANHVSWQGAERHIGWDDEEDPGLSVHTRRGVADALYGSARVVVGLLNSGSEQSYSVVELLTDEAAWQRFCAFWSALPSLMTQH